MNQCKKKRRIMRLYNQSAHLYDTQYREEQRAKISAALPHLNLKKEKIMLDIGCGTGLLFHHVADKAKLIVGIDTSRNMLNKAKRKARKQSNIALVEADTDHSPFQHQIFDVTFAITLLQNMPRPSQTLGEIKRVTRKNGAIVATGLKKTFTLSKLPRLLKMVGFKINTLKLDANDKEYVAVCSNT